MPVSETAVLADWLLVMWVGPSTAEALTDDQIDSMATMSIPGWGYGLRCESRKPQILGVI